MGKKPTKPIPPFLKENAKNHKTQAILLSRKGLGNAKKKSDAFHFLTHTKKFLFKKKSYFFLNKRVNKRV